MLALWSVKGGSGVSVTAAAIALSVARRGNEALLVDMAGDQPAVLGLADGDRPGLAEWLAAGDEVPADGLARMEVDVAPGLRLLPRGQATFTRGGRAQLLASLLAGEARVVVVDCGLITTGGGTQVPVDPLEVPAAGRASWDGSELVAGSSPAAEVVAAASDSLMVLRPCYLSLRRALVSPMRPTGLVILTEPGRPLGAHDVEEVLGLPVAAEVPVEAATARAVDAGILASRLPRGLARAVRDAA